MVCGFIHYFIVFQYTLTIYFDVCQVSTGLVSFKPCGSKFVIRTGQFMTNWVSVQNKKVTNELYDKAGVDSSMVFHEFCLGSFGDQHLVNVLLAHDPDVHLPQCR